MFGKLWCVPEDVLESARIALLTDIWMDLVNNADLRLEKHEVTIALPKDQTNWELGEALIFEAEFKSIKIGRTGQNLELAARNITRIMGLFAQVHLNNPERLNVDGTVRCRWVECTFRVLGTQVYGYDGVRVPDLP